MLAVGVALAGCGHAAPPPPVTPVRKAPPPPPPPDPVPSACALTTGVVGGFNALVDERGPSVDIVSAHLRATRFVRPLRAPHRRSEWDESVAAATDLACYARTAAGVLERSAAHSGSLRTAERDTITSLRALAQAFASTAASATAQDSDAMTVAHRKNAARFASYEAAARRVTESCAPHPSGNPTDYRNEFFAMCGTPAAARTADWMPKLDAYDPSLPWCQQKCAAYRRRRAASPAIPACALRSFVTARCRSEVAKYIADHGPLARSAVEIARHTHDRPGACEKWCGKELRKHWKNGPPPRQVSLDILVDEVAVPRGSTQGFRKRAPGDEFCLTAQDSGATLVYASGTIHDMVHAGGGTCLAEQSVPAFRADRTEVTVRDYAACVAAKACTPPHTRDHDGASIDKCTWGLRDKQDFPVNCVDFKQATDYCRFVGKRLPTAAQWVMLAHGGRASRSPWLRRDFYQFTDASCTHDGGADGPCMAGSHPADVAPTGALDVVGNLVEWTRTPLDKGRHILYGDGWEHEPYERETVSVPTGNGPPQSNTTLWYPTVNDPGIGVDDTGTTKIGIRCVRRGH